VTVTVSVEVAIVEPVVAAVAVFAMVAGAVGATAVVSVIFPAAADAAIGPGFVQVTTDAAAAHVQFVPVPETNVRPVGNVSVTVMAAVVASVPVLLTARVNAPFCPAAKFPK
jgi:hypothetical protein